MAVNVFWTALYTEAESGLGSLSEPWCKMVKKIEALERGLAALSVLETHGPQSLTELVARTGVAKATMLRILGTLDHAGFARQRLADKRWMILSRVSAQNDQTQHTIAEIAGPILDQLCQSVLWPSDVGVLQGGRIQVLETSRLQSPFLVNRDVLSRQIEVLPSAMGRALLAWSSDAKRAEILASVLAVEDPTSGLANDTKWIADIIRKTRERGYASRQTGYVVFGKRDSSITAFAVPVVRENDAVAAINVSLVSSAMSESEFVTNILPKLKDAAKDIERELGQA